MEQGIGEDFLHLAKGRDEVVKGTVKVFSNRLVFAIYKHSESITEAVDTLFFLAEVDSGLCAFSKETLRKKIVFNFKRNKSLRNAAKEADLVKNFVEPKPLEDSQSAEPPVLQTVILPLPSASAAHCKSPAPASNSSSRKRLRERNVIIAELGEKNRELSKQLKLSLKENADKEKSLSFKDKALAHLRKSKTDLHRNSIKKIFRRDKTIQTLNEELSGLKRSKAPDSDRQALESQNKTLRKKLANLRHRVKNLKIDFESDKSAAHELRETNSSLSKQVKELEECVQFLESGSLPTLQTKCDGKYIDSIRRTCMELSCRFNVSVRKVSDVVKLVLENLTDVNVSEQNLPSKSTVQGFFMEANAIAKHHVAEKLLEDFDATDLTGNVSHSDATTKNHAHYQGNQATLKSGDQLSIGLREVAGGDGNTYTAVFQDAIEDLAESSLFKTDEAKEKILASFKAIMTDRCAVNGVLGDNIDTLRREVIPKVLPEFTSLSQQEQEDILHVSRHACRMHLLANFATAAEKGVLAFETAICSGTNPHSFKVKDQSGTLRLIV